jgi:hypothetical protein
VSFSVIFGASAPLVLKRLGVRLHHITTSLEPGNRYEIMMNILFEGSLEVKLPTIWTDENPSRDEAERRGRIEERRSEEKESEERRCRCAKR